MSTAASRKLSKRKRTVEPVSTFVEVTNGQTTSRDASDEDNTETNLPDLKKKRRTDFVIEDQVQVELPPGIEERYGFKINKPPVGRPIRIYCDGIYDLFHFGHAKALEQAKKAFPNVYLLVGVCSDIETHKRKGKTVMTDQDRYEAVRHCKWVDEVVQNAPWFVDQEFLDSHKIDYVAHDAEPYQSKESGDVYAFVKDQGRFFPTERTDGISTSDLITRIVRDYDAYLRRNLERGVTAKELNISFIKERKIKTKKSIQDLKKTIRTAINDSMLLWEDKSHDFIRGFSGVFGAEDVVDKIWKYRNRNRLTSDSVESSRASSRVQSEDEDNDDDDEDDENQYDSCVEP
ncbi:cytidylyltransferase-domain-containing protein [Mucor mucedo]|uniref:cytidylyltransferase-domain-containing protein n=1 Tax=Mucor mucedo TaxID=29922 RepID=UPI00221EBC71|nr:cytidylyltransferase-domain-containing protein [Mucor mucedo]KAI7884119.1 cytidylyltransferase-domain-containing protein [Mucor mucedo]